MNFKKFILENNTLGQTILKNSFWLGLSFITERFLRAFLSIYIARTLGPSNFGKFSYALAFVSIFASFFELGLSSILTREIAIKKKRKEDVSALCTLKFLFGIFLLFVIMLLSFIITKEDRIRLVIWLLAGFCFMSNFPVIFYSYFRAFQKMEYESGLKIFQMLFFTVCGFTTLYFFPSLLNISISYLFSSFSTLIIIVLIFHYKIKPLIIVLDFKIWRRYLSLSIPLCFSSTFSLIYGYTDSIIMGYLGQNDQTGWYNAAFKIILITYSLPAITAMSFFPIVSKYAHSSIDKLQKVWNFQLGAMIVIFVPIISGGLYTSKKLIIFLFGIEYSPAIPIFEILIFLTAIYSISISCSHVLIATNHQTKTLFVTASGAIINTMLNLVFIPKYSFYGAACSSIISNLFVVVIYMYMAARYSFVSLFNKDVYIFFKVSLVACLAMIIILNVLTSYSFNIILVILISAATYLIVLYFFMRLST